MAYRHPTSIHVDFIDAVNSNIDKITKSSQTLYLLGDFNMNSAPNATNSSADKLINMFLRSNCHLLITIPTCVTNTSHTIIDNIITNDPKLLFQESFKPTQATIILCSSLLLTTLYSNPTLKTFFVEIRVHLILRLFVLNWNRIFSYSLHLLLMLIKIILTNFFPSFSR